MLKFHDTNTRRTPRTAAEAFPRSCDYACPIQRPDRASWGPLSPDEWVAIASLIALMVALPLIWPVLLTYLP